MSVQTKADLIEALEWRYATKKFDATKKISDDTWAKLERAMILTPSSYGLQPWKFVVVKNPELREKLVEVSWGQRQVAEASHLVVFARLKRMTEEHIDKYIEKIAGVRGTSRDSLQSYKSMMMGTTKLAETDAAEWMAKQCYIALGNLMTVASHYSVDNCPMEGFQKEAVDNILQLPQKGLRSVVMCALGYRASDDPYAKHAKVRFDSDELIVRI